ncbi:polyprenyl diphosphate synthase [Actinotignum schaalii]|uniref:Isoprenyl transferase n=1 Tax=Actinotignum schaalii FB123-CNA-2 TaxID=883067 RepID=S2W229_9ACTO|nr:polyprenyl diphosphate synthase [Actinotignum schaalii]EPD26617.1 di-trans,poly-cis-decaprenylcistransferase [Actinotignum schaalii FB123-CNA-2]MBS5748452.1 di-trans,poly-cis-decaprenylcistransferase [Actinotignum schaalii]
MTEAHPKRAQLDHLPHLERPTPAHRPGITPPPLGRVPEHVAIVMDGNGRWANARGLARTEGHKAGERSLMDVVAGALEVGIAELSVYAFSTENWRRSPSEVRFLMGFSRDIIRANRDQLHEWGVRVQWVGREGRLWRSVLREIRAAEELTAGNTRMVLNLCINYGGRAEIVDAVRAVAERVANGELKAERISEATITAQLYSPRMRDVDLLIRTGGEYRTSNFLMWESAYAELYFSPLPWPEFERRALWDACAAFGQRERRFGGAVDKIAPQDTGTGEAGAPRGAGAVAENMPEGTGTER